MQKVASPTARMAIRSHQPPLHGGGRGLFTFSPLRLQKHFVTLNPLKEKERIERDQKEVARREIARIQKLAAEREGSSPSAASSPATTASTTATTNSVSSSSRNSSIGASFRPQQHAGYWQWLADNGVEHAPLAVLADPSTKVRGLYATADIPEGAVVASIPFRCCLSPSTFPPAIATHYLNVPPPQYLFEAFNRRSRRRMLALKRKQRMLRRRKAAAGASAGDDADNIGHGNTDLTDGDSALLAGGFEDETSLLEVEHMWLACVIASIKHRTSANAASSSASSSQQRLPAEALPFEHLVSMFPTSTADFSLGVKAAWPVLSTSEKQDFMAIADSHEAMVYRLHRIWMQWLKRTGRDVLEEKAPSNASNNSSMRSDGVAADDADDDNLVSKNDGDDVDSDGDDDADAEYIVNKEGSVLDTLVPPSQRAKKAKSSSPTASTSASSAVPKVLVAEQVSCTLLELRWAFRMVLSRATLLPSLCEPSVPEDVGTFLGRYGIGEEGGEGDDDGHVSGPESQKGSAAEVPPGGVVTPMPCIIPLVDLVNHSEARPRNPASSHHHSGNSDSSSVPKSSLPPSIYLANCEVLTARRAAHAEDLAEVSDGMTAHWHQKEMQKKEKELQGQEDNNAKLSSAAASSAPRQNILTSQPLELESDLIDRGVIVLMAVNPIPKDTPVLLEYDTSDRAATLLKYGFV